VRLAVLGSPIAHSRSPELHAAAYRVLGLDWQYGRAEVDEASLEAFLTGLGAEWRGLSLTMPLKRAVLPLVDRHDALVDRLGLANTVLLGPEPRLFNTDVLGIEAAVRRAGTPTVDRVVVLGSGATAASALEAAARLGATRRVVAARNPDRAAQVLGGAATSVVPIASVDLADADLVISTLPGAADARVPVPAAVPGTPLLDVAYSPWPSPLGAAWVASGGRLIHGLEMLVEQAIGQLRVFVLGTPDDPLPEEDAVRRAVRDAAGLP
jgi:shikimate dehydrogenase